MSAVKAYPTIDEATAGDRRREKMIAQHGAKNILLVPRAQHEALMAEHRAIFRYLAGDTSCNGGAEIMFDEVYNQAVAAGIPEGEKIKVTWPIKADNLP